MDSIVAAVAENLRALRQATRISQETLAERAGLAADTIRRIESGRLTPSVTTLAKLALGLGIPPGVLLRGLHEPSSELVALLDTLDRCVAQLRTWAASLGGSPLSSDDAEARDALTLLVRLWVSSPRTSSSAWKPWGSWRRVQTAGISPRGRTP